MIFYLKPTLQETIVNVFSNFSAFCRHRHYPLRQADQGLRQWELERDRWEVRVGRLQRQLSLK